MDDYNVDDFSIASNGYSGLARLGSSSGQNGRNGFGRSTGDISLDSRGARSKKSTSRLGGLLTLTKSKTNKSVPNGGASSSNMTATTNGHSTREESSASESDRNSANIASTSNNDGKFKFRPFGKRTTIPPSESSGTQDLNGQDKSTASASETAVTASAVDPDKFIGDGLEFKGKIIGTELVPEPRGEKMCQNSLARIKAIVKGTKGHKKPIIMRVSFEGIKIFDEKALDMLHHHTVPEISYIARDETDTRAFGYVFGTPSTCHQFIGIKTIGTASDVMQAIGELFTVVLEQKKREAEIETRRQRSLAPTSWGDELESVSTNPVPISQASATTNAASHTVPGHALKVADSEQLGVFLINNAPSSQSLPIAQPMTDTTYSRTQADDWEAQALSILKPPPSRTSNQSALDNFSDNLDPLTSHNTSTLPEIIQNNIQSQPSETSWAKFDDDTNFDPFALGASPRPAVSTTSAPSMARSGLDRPFVKLPTPPSSRRQRNTSTSSNKSGGARCFGSATDAVPEGLTCTLNKQVDDHLFQASFEPNFTDYPSSATTVAAAKSGRSSAGQEINARHDFFADFSAPFVGFKAHANSNSHSNISSTALHVPSKAGTSNSVMATSSPFQAGFVDRFDSTPMSTSDTVGRYGSIGKFSNAANATHTDSKGSEFNRITGPNIASNSSAHRGPPTSTSFGIQEPGSFAVNSSSLIKSGRSSVGQESTRLEDFSASGGLNARINSTSHSDVSSISDAVSQANFYDGKPTTGSSASGSVNRYGTIGLFSNCIPKHEGTAIDSEAALSLHTLFPSNSTTQFSDLVSSNAAKMLKSGRLSAGQDFAASSEFFADFPAPLTHSNLDSINALNNNITSSSNVSTMPGSHFTPRTASGGGSSASSVSQASFHDIGFGAAPLASEPVGRYGTIGTFSGAVNTAGNSGSFAGSSSTLSQNTSEDRYACFAEIHELTSSIFELFSNQGTKGDAQLDQGGLPAAAAHHRPEENHFLRSDPSLEQNSATCLDRLERNALNSSDAVTNPDAVSSPSEVDIFRKRSDPFADDFFT